MSEVLPIIALIASLFLAPSGGIKENPFYYTSNLTLGIDWLQTRQVAKNPDKWQEEWNWLLDEHPSERAVDNYFAGVILGNILMHKLLGEKERKVFGIGLTALELAAIENNRRLGIKAKWDF